MRRLRKTQPIPDALFPRLTMSGGAQALLAVGVGTAVLVVVAVIALVLAWRARYVPQDATPTADRVRNMTCVQSASGGSTISGTGSSSEAVFTVILGRTCGVANVADVYASIRASMDRSTVDVTFIESSTSGAPASQLEIADPVDATHARQAVADWSWARRVVDPSSRLLVGHDEWNDDSAADTGEGQSVITAAIDSSTLQRLRNDPTGRINRLGWKLTLQGPDGRKRPESVDKAAAGVAMITSAKGLPSVSAVDLALSATHSDAVEAHVVLESRPSVGEQGVEDVGLSIYAEGVGAPGSTTHEPSELWPALRREVQELDDSGHAFSFTVLESTRADDPNTSSKSSPSGTGEQSTLTSDECSTPPGGTTLQQALWAYWLAPDRPRSPTSQSARCL